MSSIPITPNPPVQTQPPRAQVLPLQQRVVPEWIQEDRGGRMSWDTLGLIFLAIYLAGRLIPPRCPRCGEPCGELEEEYNLPCLDCIDDEGLERWIRDDKLDKDGKRLTEWAGKKLAPLHDPGPLMSEKDPPRHRSVSVDGQADLQEANVRAVLLRPSRVQRDPGSEARRVRTPHDGRGPAVSEC